MAVIIETRELSFRYSEDSPLALEDVTLSIEEGSFTAVLGHNGSGKSTFAKHLNAILLPSGGKVYVGGIDTADESRLFDIRKTAGMVFQNPDNQIVANVVEEDVAFACENMGLPPEEIRRREDKTDRAEDRLGNYLIRLSAQPLSQADSEEAAKLLKVIGDFERIADHAVNLLDSAEELRDKQLAFSEAARRELSVLTAAVREVLQLALTAFTQNDLEAAFRVEPLKEVIDGLKEQLRTRHILRLQKGECQVETGFVWSDLLTSLERAADHSSNIAGCVIDADQHRLDLHQTLRAVRQESEDFRQAYRAYVEKYALS